MLLQIRDYLRRHRVASNQQIAREFQIELQALQPMLDLWLRKGVIACCQEKSDCQSSCFKCKTQPPVYYQTLEAF
ncbi:MULTISPECIES: FeoC-like transcriptional regulator [Legionella]|uniref:FeoC like transcriptional regulator n=1 Tax=Legionella maceachernii TaxID=466 RepID=A0A0W0W765_9GAMM|nr:FeoC-like transcriptional regulator [Legionella maceachernii]KTD28062.1 FeoC like transcriptional regulator [Legionella maceachernii]SKA07845.1 FeoC like transcriptional regulator [Legionella maceachernii]SUO99773.1 FeoC like transcriptional regulator [Legionella maceachernii]